MRAENPEHIKLQNVHYYNFDNGYESLVVDEVDCPEGKCEPQVVIEDPQVIIEEPQEESTVDPFLPEDADGDAIILSCSHDLVC